MQNYNGVADLFNDPIPSNYLIGNGVSVSVIHNSTYTFRSDDSHNNCKAFNNAILMMRNYTSAPDTVLDIKMPSGKLRYKGVCIPYILRVFYNLSRLMIYNGGDSTLLTIYHDGNVVLSGRVSSIVLKNIFADLLPLYDQYNDIDDTDIVYSVEKKKNDITMSVTGTIRECYMSI